MSYARIHQEGLSRADQLALDFNVSQGLWVADQVHAITSGSSTFHPEKSTISENRFDIRISYLGRSYAIKGIYKKEVLRSFYEEDFSGTAIRIIRFESILGFRDGRYIPVLLPKKEYNEIEKNIQNILSTSSCNTTLH